MRKGFAANLSRTLSILFVLYLTCIAAWPQVPATAPSPMHFQVTIAPSLGAGPFSGRLLVLMTRQKPAGEAIRPGLGESADDTWIAAVDVSGAKPGDAIELDPDKVAYPAAFSQAPKGDYWAMAMLDRDNNAAYRFLTPGDLTSAIVSLPNLQPASAGAISLTLTRQIPPTPAPPAIAEIEIIDFVSPSLSAFWKHDVHMRGCVLLPPGYASGNERYPVVYFTHGFGAELNDLRRTAARFKEETAAHKLPEMIWVLLDESFFSGTHEFADSANNGPWGKALTEELIPYLEAHYRMDARPSGRLLTGHSSGGWATLWLQVNYPKIFGGTWSTSPDPVDFHYFTGPDLADSPPQNYYHSPSGQDWPLVRVNNKPVETLRQLAQQEAVVGPVGGQMASFEWVFSPRCPGKKPCPLFDRKTGNVDPRVARYWEEHYDIARLVRERWPQIGADLKGKIHIIVGTWDTFYLDVPVTHLEKVLKELGADAHIDYLPERDHFNLYSSGLLEQIAHEMYKVARPKAEAAATH